jgi:type IX secretion system PorP/SprF family membrane protein
MKIKVTLKIFALIISLSIYTTIAKAQSDPHFSQYYAHPLYLNPALTGVIDGDYRGTVNLKQQWGGLQNSFLTGAASFDVAPKKNLAFGATVLNQGAGELSYNYLSVLVSGAYSLKFGYNGLQIINFGLQAGFINRSFNLSQGRFGNQYNPDMGYDGGMSNGESFASTSSFVPDVNAGIMYFDGNPNQNVNIFAGASVSHLTKPTEHFGDNSLRTPIRTVVHGGARIRVSDVLDIVPNGLYMSQGTASETSIGAYAQFMVNNSSNILFGSNYRVKDATIAFVGLQLKNMVFGLSYDVNTSPLKKATNYAGGVELSISLIGRNGLIGPNFFCPRL